MGYTATNVKGASVIENGATKAPHFRCTVVFDGLGIGWVELDKHNRWGYYHLQSGVTITNLQTRDDAVRLLVNRERMWVRNYRNSRAVTRGRGHRPGTIV